MRQKMIKEIKNWQMIIFLAMQIDIFSVNEFYLMRKI
jgi:hypothetical protein